MDVELKISRSITYIFTHAQYSNRWSSRVPNLQGREGGGGGGGGAGAKTVTYIWRSQGRDCNVATGATPRLPSLAALGNKTKHHDI